MSTSPGAEDTASSAKGVMVTENSASEDEARPNASSDAGGQESQLSSVPATYQVIVRVT